MKNDLPKPHLPVESTFNRIIQEMGGKRVDAMLDETPDWDNADYVFESPAIVAELKEVHQDSNDDAGLSERITKIYEKYMKLGAVPPIFGSQKIRIDQLPEECRLEMMTPFKRKLEGPVKKAAKQIKETKRQLGLPDAAGMLILVNEGSTFLNPALAFHFLHHILNKQYRSIDHIVFCSVNMLLRGPAVPEGGLFWSNAGIDGRAQIPKQFLSKLRATWMSVLDDEIGVPGYVKSIEGDAFDEIDALKFEPAEAGKDSPMFVRAKHFYECTTTGYKYYCESVSGATAQIYLVESYQHGKLIQAVFEQKLVHASYATYREITDADEKRRLKAMVKKVRRS